MEKTLGDKIKEFFEEVKKELNRSSLVGRAFSVFKDDFTEDEIGWIFSDLLVLDSVEVEKIKYFLESEKNMTLNKTLILIEFILVFFENSFEELVELIANNPNGFGMEIMNQDMLSRESKQKVLDGLKDGSIVVKNFCCGRNG